MKIYAYYVEYHRGDAPPNPPRNVGDATHIELIKSPTSNDGVYLYVAWKDKTKYLQAWGSRGMLLGLMETSGLKPMVVDERVWSSSLEREILADANPRPYLSKVV